MPIFAVRGEYDAAHVLPLLVEALSCGIAAPQDDTGVKHGHNILSAGAELRRLVVVSISSTSNKAA